MRSASLPTITPAPTPRLATAAAWAALLALGACGGGGGETAAPVAAATPAPAAPAPAPAAPAPAPVATSSRVTCNLTNFQAEMLSTVNAYRRAGATCGAQGAFKPTSDLTWNAALTQAAVTHSDDMVARNFFSHTGSDGSSVGTRTTAAGYAWSGVGENIAAGQATVAVVVDGWMKSDGHCANLMNPKYRDIGVACVAGNTNTSYRTYWTQVFGTPR